MPFVKGSNISFKFEKQKSFLLSKVNFSISDSSKIGIVGDNGSGKSTLLNIISGNLNPEIGHVHSTFERVGVVDQVINKKKYVNGWSYLFGENTVLSDLKQAILRFQEGVSDPYIFADYSTLGGNEFELNIEEKCRKMKFNSLLLNDPIDNLSGGEETKLKVIKALMQEPQLLLLDEPTNHLDKSSQLWLSSFLNTSSIPFVSISHNRGFLDIVANEIWHLKRGRIDIFSGNYTFFETSVREKEVARALSLAKNKKKIEQLDLAAEKRRKAAMKNEKFKAKRSVKKNGGICKRDDSAHTGPRREQSIMKGAKVLERKSAILRERNLDLKKEKENRKPIFFKDEHRKTSKVILSGVGLSKSYKSTLFQDLNIMIRRGEKVSIEGKNGSGKSTLLKILTGQLKPDSGEVHMSPSVRLRFIEQNLNWFLDEGSVYEFLIEPNIEKGQLLRNLMGSLGLKHNLLEARVCDLSCGERVKLSVIEALVDNPDILVLDEPTNYLEMSSRLLLEEALAGYKGTLLFVSHDSLFSNKIAQRKVIL